MDSPILFSGPMVRAILEDRKTQTRRVMKLQPDNDAVINMGEIGLSRGVAYAGNSRSGGIRTRIPCPYGQPGDRLWVRETWGWDWYDDGQTRAWKRPVYRADPCARPSDNGSPGPWRPSIHMPRNLSRITLEITGVRVERLQDISKSDCIAEGMENLADVHAGWHQSYADLWDSINAKRGFGWDANTWVWVIDFKRHQSTERKED